MFNLKEEAEEKAVKNSECIYTQSNFVTVIFALDTK